MSSSNRSESQMAKELTTLMPAEIRQQIIEEALESLEMEFCVQDFFREDGRWCSHSQDERHDGMGIYAYTRGEEGQRGSHKGSWTMGRRMIWSGFEECLGLDELPYRAQTELLQEDVASVLRKHASRTVRFFRVGTMGPNDIGHPEAQLVEAHPVKTRARIPDAAAQAEALKTTQHALIWPLEPMQIIPWWDEDDVVDQQDPIFRVAMKFSCLTIDWSVFSHLKSLYIDLSHMLEYLMFVPMPYVELATALDRMGEHLNLERLVVSGLVPVPRYWNVRHLASRWTVAEVEDNEELDPAQPNWIRILRESLRPGGELVLLHFMNGPV